MTIDGSNRRKPDISAPGVSVRSAVRGGGCSSLSGHANAAGFTIKADYETLSREVIEKLREAVATAPAVNGREIKPR